MGQKMVVLNRFEVLKEALVTQGDGFADRPDLPLVDDVAHGQGVVFSNGNIWKQQRRFALSTLKYFGLGKKSLEPVILGKPFNPHLIVNNAVSNVICSLVFGHRLTTVTRVCETDEVAGPGDHIHNLLRLGFSWQYPEIHKSTVRLWCFVLLTKVQAEIDSGLAQTAGPQRTAQVPAPHTDAVIHEVQRISNIVPPQPASHHHQTHPAGRHNPKVNGKVSSERTSGQDGAFLFTSSAALHLLHARR
ncbi:cytochrome P450 2J6-like protein [Lates japonicus]|uniref:Cytochrome P450 2J6-like protein n=1 Tax=Lates japonicus TaxID=270547 RepID=A0AAD3MAK8_LATJO|nr:cytochrome P450 2J6-like protein [Lates japonicus]